MERNLSERILDNFASKTILALLGIAGTVVTIYAFFQEKNVDVRYEIIANTNVLDFNEDLSKLEVLYDSTNLKQTHENLRIVTVRVINNGQEHLLKEFYDLNDPLGIKISSGTIIEKPELIQTSSDYLKRNLKFSNSDNQITFPQVILESGEFFILKLLILHKTDVIPNIQSYGKIAGQKKIQVVNAVDVKNEKGFWENVYYGNIWTQLLRLISYFLAVVLIIVILIFLTTQIDNKREKKHKLKMVAEFKNLKNYQYTRMDDAIFDRYKTKGFYDIRKMNMLLKDEEELNENYKKLSEELKSKEFRKYRRIQDKKLRLYYERDNWSLINEMVQDGVLIKEDDTLTINQAMRDTIEKFTIFLKTKEEFEVNKMMHRPYYEMEFDEEFEEENDDKNE